MNIPPLMTAYCARRPDAVRDQGVAFGTLGHRGAAIDGAFNEGPVLAITQTSCLYQTGTPG